MKIVYLIIIVCLASLLIFGGSKLFLTNEKSNPIQQTVEAKYTNDKGLIYTYPLKPDSHYLSESIGLYMQYLKVVKHKEPFQTQYIFPEYVDVEKISYEKDKEIHMIDQLLIAINRKGIGQDSPLFDKSIINEWKERGKLYGKYNRLIKNAAELYESLSV